MITVPTSIISSGKLEVFSLVFEEIGTGSSLLLGQILLYLVANGASALFSMLIIKDESAVMRQAVMLLVIPSVWLYFLGQGTEQFSWLELCGMLLVVAATLYYVHVDRLAVEQER